MISLVIYSLVCVWAAVAVVVTCGIVFALASGRGHARPSEHAAERAPEPRPPAARSSAAS